MPNSKFMKPVALPPGRARLSTKPLPTGSVAIGNTIGTVRVICSNCPTVEPPEARMTSGASATNSAACRRMSPGIGSGPADIDLQVAADRPAQQRQPLQERSDAGLIWRIVRGCGQEHADTPHPLGLLRSRHQRPRRRRAAEQRDELAAFHSITSSARAKLQTAGEAERLRRFQIDDQFETGWLLNRKIGRLVPFRIRST